MSAIWVAGAGAVSPAGWGAASLCQAVEARTPLPTKPLARPGRPTPFQARPVPAPGPEIACLAHARLRRSSPISRYTVAAALEAIGADVERVRNGSLQLGVILCVMSGGVNYSRRFYDEVLRDPAGASPILFPETVFNAPASHLAAMLGAKAINYTLVGDPGMFLVGLAMAAQWLEQARVDGCVVIGAEELDWLTSDVYRMFERNIILSEGAGALYLRRETDHPRAVKLERVTEAQPLVKSQSRVEAARQVRAELPPPQPGRLLVDGTQNLPRLDAAELKAWQDWTGPRYSPKATLGEGLAAASAWQCVLAVEALKQGRYAGANVSVVGCNQQAVGAHFARSSMDVPTPLRGFQS